MVRVLHAQIRISFTGLESLSFPLFFILLLGVVTYHMCLWDMVCIRTVRIRFRHVPFLRVMLCATFAPFRGTQILISPSQWLVNLRFDMKVVYHFVFSRTMLNVLGMILG